MIELDQTREGMTALLQDIFNRRRLLAGPMYTTRAAFWKKFLQIGLPVHRSEKYQHFPLRNFYSEKFEEVHAEVFLHREMVQEEVLPECIGSNIVLVNGRLRFDLSDLSALHNKIVLLPLEKAIYSYEIFLTNRYQKVLAHEENPFVLLNNALNQEGVFLYIPPHVQVKQPIQILHFIAGKEGYCAQIHPKIQIFVGTGSDVSFVRTHHFTKLQCPVWMNQTTDVVLEEKTRMHLLGDDVIESGHYLFDITRVTQKKDSYLSLITATAGSKSVYYDIHTELQGEGAAADINGLWFSGDHSQTHTQCHVAHQAPSTTSNQLFKGVLLDESLSSFVGKIFVGSIAQQTVAYQLNNNLLIGERVKAYTKPNLEIFADDVKASHGATLGYFGSEELFYLRARGLSKKEAVSYLTMSFIEAILAKIWIPSLCEDYRECISHIIEADK